MIVSAAAAISPTSTPWAIAALNTRAPSMWTAMPCSSAACRSAPSASSGQTVPPWRLCVFSTHTAAVSGWWWSSVARTAARAWSALSTPARVGTWRIWIPPRAAAPAPSDMNMCESASAMISCPDRASESKASRLPIVPLAT